MVSKPSEFIEITKQEEGRLLNILLRIEEGFDNLKKDKEAPHGVVLPYRRNIEHPRLLDVYATEENKFYTEIYKVGYCIDISSGLPNCRIRKKIIETYKKAGWEEIAFQNVSKGSFKIFFIIPKWEDTISLFKAK